MGVVLVIGGARSGKSTYAEELAGSLTDNVGYIATGQALDNEMQERIKLHRANRPAIWTTYEEPFNVSDVISKNQTKHQVFLLDCLTLLISNILLKGLNIDKMTQDDVNEREKLVLAELQKLLGEVQKSNVDLIIVTNEVGLGLVPSIPLSRAYRDIVGRANQFLASEASQVVLVWAGIPIQIKPELGRINNEKA